MSRLPFFFVLLASLLFSGLTLAPDAHAGENGAMTHVGDHIAAHGMEHFADTGDTEERQDSDHPPAQHHNCSVDLPRAMKENTADRTFGANLFAPLKDALLLSGALKVLIEPPIA